MISSLEQLASSNSWKTVEIPLTYNLNSYLVKVEGVKGTIRSAGSKLLKIVCREARDQFGQKKAADNMLIQGSYTVGGKHYATEDLRVLWIRSFLFGEETGESILPRPEHNIKELISIKGMNKSLLAHCIKLLVVENLIHSAVVDSMLEIEVGKVRANTLPISLVVDLPPSFGSSENKPLKISGELRLD